MSDAPLSISFPPELPVSQRREEIARAISENQVVIVAGETGSGKTTQLPKILLELGYEHIGHTQPRRIAARTIAERIAEELGSDLGALVGYQVRFTDKVSAATRIKLMTDGILLNEIHRDRLLKRYDAIIIDEAHERSLTIDFLIGFLRRLLPQRPDLKVIITSATIDPESFAAHFADASGTPAPIVEVSGRTFPVEVRYRPLVPDAAGGDSDDARQERDLVDAIGDAVDELSREAPGDVLVFLSGEGEIRDAEDTLRGRFAGTGTEILPLYGRLSAADQHRVFQRSTTAGTRRRIVLSTNVAETSLTVPGIRFVVDAGTARISRYSARAKIQRLPIEAISQASANQRSGRSGRTSDGIAIRLYSESDFAARPEFTDPEILRTSLAAVILQMLALDLGDIAEFPFLQPPDSRGIKDGLELLRELRAVDNGRLTRIGRDLSRLPLDPRLARMILESKSRGTAREVIAIVAGLSIQDPRERPLDRRAQADQQHARFTDPSSDFLGILNLWNYLEEKQSELSGNQFRRLCRSEYLNYLRIREWQDLVRQLIRAAKSLGIAVGDPAIAPDEIHRSILAGLLSQIGMRDSQKRDFAGARNQRFVVFPGSALAKKQPEAVMAAELVETSRLFARTVAAIDPAWAEQLAGDLVKRSYSEPHWEKKQGAAVAFEKVTLFGVPIVARRRVQFARIDAAWARELFIRHGLVEGDWPVDRGRDRLFDFDRANRALRADLEEIEERTRRRGKLLDDEAIAAFYDARIPADVVSTRTFEAWWRTQRASTPDMLTMTEADLVDDDAPAAPERVDADFPTSWEQGGQRLALSYRFDPGAPDDGVTVVVPLALVARVSPIGFDWLVPGLREELVTALIKTLPKAIRRNVVPAADWARRLLDNLPAAPEHEGVPIIDYLAAQIQRTTHTPAEAEDFDEERLPPHLRVAFSVVDDRGREVARSRDLVALQHKLRTRVRESVARATARTPHAIERDGLTTWDFDVLPRHIDTKQGPNVIRGYPTLVDSGSAVAIRLMATPSEQEAGSAAGVRRLLMLTIPSPLSYVREHLSQTEKLALATSPYQNTQALFDDCLVAVIDQRLRSLAPDGLLWTRDEFESARASISAQLVDALYSCVGTVVATLQAARSAERALSQATSMAVLPAISDARAQLSAIVYPGFIARTGVDRLRHVPRYLSGIHTRLQKLPTELARDRAWMNEVHAATARYAAAGGVLPSTGRQSAQLEKVRWMLEELRVSLFAQHLGTAETVSLQRISKALAD